jgi:F0F1-type ATP synthase assembly protein I
MADPDRSTFVAAMRYAAFGFEFAAIITAGVVSGYYLDRAVGTAPLFTLLLTIGGMIGALRRLIWSLKKHSSP